MRPRAVPGACLCNAFGPLAMKIVLILVFLILLLGGAAAGYFLYWLPMQQAKKAEL